MNIGSLGLGAALQGGLNTGFDMASRLAEHEKARYLDSSDQINQYQKNLADIWGNHNRQLEQAAQSPELAQLMRENALGTVNSFEQATNQQQLAQQAPAIQQQVAQTTLGDIVRADPTGGTQPFLPPMPQMTPEQMSAEYYRNLQMTNGNVEASLGGAIGYGTK